MKKLILAALLAGTWALPTTTHAQGASPMEVRGIPLGITLDEFRVKPVINDSGMVDLQTWCSNDNLPKNLHIDPRAMDKEAGVVSCQWFSEYPGMSYRSPSEHWIDLGKGKGPPVFNFIKDGSTYRLYQIKFYANTEYYNGILAALTGKYGQPKVATKPFQTRAGAMFESSTSSWTSGTGSITFIFRCRHVARYCLSFNHLALTKKYQDARAQIDTKQNGKI